MNNRLEEEKQQQFIFPSPIYRTLNVPKYNNNTIINKQSKGIHSFLGRRRIKNNITERRSTEADIFENNSLSSALLEIGAKKSF
uniref:Uncharacterized protein n=1 Tax=Meloidogyne hapla TaxID=6305 RepID=A0A1I8BGN9_MELHA